jgi:hypothetical protein
MNASGFPPFTRSVLFYLAYTRLYRRVIKAGRIRMPFLKTERTWANVRANFGQIGGAAGVQNGYYRELL